MLALSVVFGSASFAVWDPRDPANVFYHTSTSTYHKAFDGSMVCWTEVLMDGTFVSGPETTEAKRTYTPLQYQCDFGPEFIEAPRAIVYSLEVLCYGCGILVGLASVGVRR